MLLTQRNLQRADDKLVGLDILKSEFRVTEEDVMVIKASRSKSTRFSGKSGQGEQAERTIRNCMSTRRNCG